LSPLSLVLQAYSRAEAEGAAALADEKRAAAKALAKVQSQGMQQYQQTVDRYSDSYVRDMEAQVPHASRAVAGVTSWAHE
jgi:hypothetical protein